MKCSTLPALRPVALPPDWPSLSAPGLSDPLLRLPQTVKNRPSPGLLYTGSHLLYRAELPERHIGGGHRGLLQSEPQLLRQNLPRRVGKSPQEFLISYRMTKAAELLKLTELSINDLSNAVGYPNQLHFSRAFKKTYGIPPRQWRQENKMLRSPSTTAPEPISLPISLTDTFPHIPTRIWAC